MTNRSKETIFFQNSNGRDPSSNLVGSTVVSTVISTPCVVIETWVTEWESVLTPIWKFLHRAFQVDSPRIAARRLVACGLTVHKAKRLKNIMEYQSKYGILISDAVAVQIALDATSEASTSAEADTPPNPWISNVVSPFNYLTPHTLKIPNESHLTVSIRNTGPLNAIEAESSYHGTMAFISTIGGLYSDLSSHRSRLELAMVATAPYHVSTYIQVHMAIAAAKEMFRYLSIIHSITGLVYTRAAMSSEYQACHYLSIHWVFRHLTTIFVGIIFILNLSDVLLYVDIEGELSWWKYYYSAILAVQFVLTVLYEIIMIGRGYTSHWEPPYQWFRWFPLGYQSTSNRIGELLDATGCYHQNAELLKWKDSVINGVTQAATTR